MRFTEIDEREQENVAGFSCFFKKTSPGAGEKRIAASLALLAMTWASVSAPKERRADLFPVIARRGKAPTWQSVLRNISLPCEREVARAQPVTEGFRPQESCPKNGIPQSSPSAMPAPFNKGAKGREIRIATSARWASLSLLSLRDISP